jgi:hypothetical protein
MAEHGKKRSHVRPLRGSTALMQALQASDNVVQNRRDLNSMARVNTARPGIATSTALPTVHINKPKTLGGSR